MASSGNLCDKGKRILEELQKKACELSTILGSDVPEKSSSKPPQQDSSCGSSSSASRSCMPSFRRQDVSAGDGWRGAGGGWRVADDG